MGCAQSKESPKHGVVGTSSSDRRADSGKATNGAALGGASALSSLVSERGDQRKSSGAGAIAGAAPTIRDSALERTGDDKGKPSSGSGKAGDLSGHERTTSSQPTTRSSTLGASSSQVTAGASAQQSALLDTSDSHLGAMVAAGQPSAPNRRSSAERASGAILKSHLSETTTASQGARNSPRSSFAADAAAAALGAMTHDRMSTLSKAPQAGSSEATAAADAVSHLDASLPAHLAKYLSALVVVPADTPVPTTMLQNLWQTATLAETLTAIQALQAHSMLRVAQLEDQSTWCLVAPATLAALQAQHAERAAGWHAQLVDAYCRGSSAGGGGEAEGGQAVAVKDVPDDGYFMQNVGHHLVGCGRLGALRSLLGEPAWLEAKLHAYGTATVVADFRRYLAHEPEDTGVRLLLQAFQLSLGCCAEHAGTHMLREQMLARLMHAALHSEPPRAAPAAPPAPATPTPSGKSTAAATPRSLSGQQPAAVTAELVASASAQPHHLAAEKLAASPAAPSQVTLLDPTRDGEEGVEVEEAADQLSTLPNAIRLDQIASDLARATAAAAAQAQASGLHHQSSQVSEEAASSVAGSSSAVQPPVTTPLVVARRSMSRARTGSLSGVQVPRLVANGVLSTAAASAAAPAGAQQHQQQQQQPQPRDSARYPGAEEGLREWFEQQCSHALMRMCAVAAAGGGAGAGGACVHLLPRSASLKQAGGLQRMILRGHTASISKVVISPNGQDVVTVSDDGSAQVWDMNVGDCVMQLARQQPLSDVAVAPDGCLCVVASVDGAACVWDLATGGVKHVLRGHTSKVNSVAIDRAGRRCVTASDDRSVRVWSIEHGTCEAVLAGHGHGQGGGNKGKSGEFGLVFSVALSSDGAFAATASEDFTARIWDLDEAKCEHVLQGHSGWVVAVRFIGDTTRVITASHDQTARIWDCIRGLCLHVLTGHTGRLSGVCVDHQGTIAVTSSDDGTARVWEVESGKCRCVLQRHDAWVSDAAITRDGQRCVTVGGDGLACLWDCNNGELLATLEGHTGALNSVVLTGGGRFAVTAGEDCTARVWDLGNVKDLQQVQGHRARITVVKPIGGGRQVVTACEDGEVMVWDVGTGKAVRTMKGHSSSITYLSVTKDGAKIISGTSNRNVCVWDAQSGEMLSMLPGQQGSRVKEMHATRDGQLLGVVLFDSSTAVWDLTTGKLVSQLIGRGERVGRNVHTGGVNGIMLCGLIGEEQQQAAATALTMTTRGGAGGGSYAPSASQSLDLTGRDSSANALQHPSGPNALLGSYPNNLLMQSGKDLMSARGSNAAPAARDSGQHVPFAQHIVDVLSPAPTVRGSGDTAVSVATSVAFGAGGAGWTPSALAALAGRRAVTWSKDCTARVWELAGAAVRGVCEGHADGVRCAALSGDEVLLATGSYSNCVRLHSVEDAAPVAVLDHAAPAVLVQFSPDGTLLAVALENHTVVIWDLVAHSCLPPLPAHKSDISGLSFSPNSTLLATCSQDCTMRVWDARTGREVAFFVADAALTSCCFAGGGMEEDAGGVSDIVVVADAGGAAHFLDLPLELQPGVPSCIY